MLGLIKKDLLIAKGNLKTLAIIFVVFTFMGINGNGNFSFIPAFMSVMVMMSTFSYDEYNKTDAFIISLPNGKRNAVKAKYTSTILIILISSILTFIISMIIGYAQNNLNMENVLSATIGCCVGIILLQAVLFPLIYKFGIEKSRIGIFIGIFGITSIASILVKDGLKIPPSLIILFNNYWMIIIPLGIIIVLFISYKISEYLYLKKEF